MFFEKQDTIIDIPSEEVFFLAIASNQINTSFQGNLAASNGYLVAYKQNGSYNILAYLFYRDMARAQIFFPEAPSSTRMALQRYQYAGLDFLEAMGFIMEPVNLKAMTQVDKKNFIEALPFMFHDDLNRYVKDGGEGGAANYLLSGPQQIDYSEQPMNQMETEMADNENPPDEAMENPVDMASSFQSAPALFNNLTEEQKDELKFSLGKLLASF